MEQLSLVSLCFTASAPRDQRETNLIDAITDQWKIKQYFSDFWIDFWSSFSGNCRVLWQQSMDMVFLRQVSPND